MENIFTINKCSNCEGDKRICPFFMEKYKGKRDKTTGFYVAHIVEEEDGCILYSGFMI